MTVHKLDVADQPTREELMRIRGKDFKPVPTDKKFAKVRSKSEH